MCIISRAVYQKENEISVIIEKNANSKSDVAAK